MMKHEFEQRIGREISNEDYEKVQTVYTYYPAKGLDKDKVAEMYRIFGMRIFEDMLPRAKKVMELEIQIQQAKKALSEL